MAMSDKELLEASASAVGFTFLRYHLPVQDRSCVLSTTWDGAWAEVIKPYAPLGNCRWNPLTNDSDAFELLVRRRMNLVFYTMHDIAFVAVESEGESYEEAYNVNGDGGLEATRRAITRAAAQDGGKDGIR